MVNPKSKSILLKTTKGVVSYFTDLLLFMVLYGVESSFSGYGSRANGKAYARATRQFTEIKEGSTLQNLGTLKKKGYITYSRGKSDVEITVKGKKRLQRALPIYERRRKWDGKLYLITYDIPESKRIVRNMFREQLKKLGCGMLQASVWITPYDPREVLRNFVRSNRLEGEVLISYVGEDSNVAGITLKELLERVYHLDELNKRYGELIGKPLEKWPGYKVALEFYSILKDDPQLPFSLLPKGWKGDKACKRVMGLLHVRPHVGKDQT